MLPEDSLQKTAPTRKAMQLLEDDHSNSTGDFGPNPNNKFHHVLEGLLKTSTNESEVPQSELKQYAGLSENEIDPWQSD